MATKMCKYFFQVEVPIRAMFCLNVRQEPMAPVSTYCGGGGRWFVQELGKGSLLPCLSWLVKMQNSSKYTDRQIRFTTSPTAHSC